MALGLAMALSSCAPPPGPGAFQLPFQPRYDGAHAAMPVLLASEAWWRDLGDPTLDRLVDRALAGNLSLATARARVTAAENAVAAVPGEVTIGSELRADISGTDQIDPDTSSAAELGFDWLFDPWGVRASRIRAAEARQQAAAAELNAARLLVLLELSDAYLELRYRQRLVAILEAELSGRRDTLRLTEQLAAADEATLLEITRARSRAAQIRADLPEARAAVRAQEARIAVLTGTSPGALPADLAHALAAGGAQPRPRMSPEVGIPADLLRNRPDLQVAEALYYAAVAEIGVVRGDLYPRLSLGGAITLNAAEATTGAQYFLGPVVRFPALPAGPARARVAERTATAEAAYHGWREAALDAVGEVEDALLDYAATTEAEGAAAEAARLARETQALTRSVYERGEAVLGDLVDAEDEIAQAERRRARLHFARARAYVALHVRLGAGHAPNS